MDRERFGMALIDDNVEELNTSNIGELEAVESLEQQQTTNEPVNSVQQEDNIPEKYRGKSVNDIVKMHQEAEKLIGRQAQEVGEVRKLADDLLKQQLSQRQSQLNTPEQQKQQQQPQEVDFFEDPNAAIKQAVSNHPDVLAAKQAAAQFKALQAKSALEKKHPDFAQVVQDGEFIEWVKGSPLRLNLYAMANSGYDFTAADELLSTFKQIRTVKTQQTQEAGQQVRKQNLKAAAVDTGGTGESSKKVYRRADLIRLRMTDPNRYDALQDEIMAAYAEGRVR
jgi:hypothetical protein